MGYLHHLASRSRFSIVRNNVLLSGLSRQWTRNSHILANSRKPSPTPVSAARTRFAPSPTGYAHLGSLRTALFNYLFAKATGGQFLLRVEDTDRARRVHDAEQRLYDDLQWAGLAWDEGPDVGGQFGPYRQSDRLAVYKPYTKTLLANDKAYRCFCSTSTLDKFKLSSDNKQSIRYPGLCRAVSQSESDERAAAGEPHVVRFKSGSHVFSFKDGAYGTYRKKDPEEDFVLIKSDGFPTYHFANVVDDHLMQITHVIRGEEWLISTPKHLALYDAFGWRAPSFAHLGLLVGPDGEKLSKRSSDISVKAYRDKGILPSALVNWLALHGSRLLVGTGKSEYVENLQGLVEKFSYGFTKGAIVPNFDKLRTIQAQHLSHHIDTNSDLVDSLVVDRVLECIHQMASTTTPLVPPLRDPFSALARAYITRMLQDSGKKHLDVPTELTAEYAPLIYAVSARTYEKLAAAAQPSDNGPNPDLSRLYASALEKLDEIPQESEWTLLQINAVVKHVVTEESALMQQQQQQQELPVSPATSSNPAPKPKSNANTKLHTAMRSALLGRSTSSGRPTGILMHLLGRDETVRRLQLARKYLA